jgi:hypothetical protein
MQNGFEEGAYLLLKTVKMFAAWSSAYDLFLLLLFAFVPECFILSAAPGMK